MGGRRPRAATETSDVKRRAAKPTRRTVDAQNSDCTALSVTRSTAGLPSTISAAAADLQRPSLDDPPPDARLLPVYAYVLAGLFVVTVPALVVVGYFWIFELNERRKHAMRVAMTILIAMVVIEAPFVWALLHQVPDVVEPLPSDSPSS